jgi:hypothetical protein
MNSITIALQRAALTTFFTSVSGIKTVFTRVPMDVQNSELPAAILEPGEAAYYRGNDSYGIDSLRIVRAWTLKLLAMRMDQGKEFAAEAAVEPFLTSIPDLIASYSHLKTSETPARIFDIIVNAGSDPGIQTITHSGGTDYLGTTFTFYTETVEPVRLHSV